MTCRLLLSALTLALSVAVHAQQEYVPDTLKREYTTQTMNAFGLGTAQMLDTYLSHEKYSGMELRFLNQTERRDVDSRWSRMLHMQATLDYGSSRSDDGSMMDALFDFGYARHYSWSWMADRLQLQVGAMGEAYLGLGYCLRNQNNPVQMHLGTHISPSAIVSWRTHLWSRPLKLRYQVEMPLIGVMFAPNYGQSYYEIFNRGNYDHNVVVTHPFNAFSIRQMVSADMSWGRHTLRIGFNMDIRQAEVNRIKQHNYSGTVMVGLVRHFQLSDITAR